MKNLRYIASLIMMSMALGLSARTFVQNEELYVNVQQDFDWSTAGAKLYLYCFNSTASLWLDLQPENGKIYKAVFPSAGTYNQLIVVRKNPANASPDWTGVWTQTADIDIPDDWNCVHNFADASRRWKMYAPALAKVGAYAATLSPENMSVCPGSAGDPFSLKAKLNAAKTAYAYGDVHGHGWYCSTDLSTWTSIDGYSGLARDGEQYIDTVIALPNPIPAGGIYYYLHSSKPDGRRLIYIKPDAVKCALDCEITTFETAISAVNADDNTYTLDGMVAFGKANGNLVITCDGRSITIPSPKSPQSFALTGVPAATVDGQTTYATAYFEGDPSACAKTITILVPNATEAVRLIRCDSLTGRDFVLRPADAESGNQYVWLVRDDRTGQVDTVHGAPQTLVVGAFDRDTTLTYIYKEYYPASGSMEDLMTNGSYDDATTDYGTYGNVSTISDYNFWGRFPQTATTPVNFYTDTAAAGVNPGKLNRNGFAVVRNAHNFWQSYVNIRAHDGTDFALFDAETGAAGGNKKAWYATTASNPKLKLQKGTTYVLSFWAANINNYGEMDNAARFVFRIEYNGHVWNSDTLDLSKPEFRNNLWHQHSETFYADENCNNVTISVVNLNTNTLNIGNDFALDDIQFHPISSVSKVVKSQQQFVLTAHEPRIDAFTATVKPVACEGTDYRIAMHVEYTNPSGQLCIRDITRDTIYQYTLPTAALETPVSFDEDIVIATKEPTHNWEVYFSDWTTARQTAATSIPGFPSVDTVHIAFSPISCTDLTTTLTFDLDYTYQQGTFTYWVDALPPQTATYNIANPTKQTLTNLTIANIPADGNTHKLYISFNGANSCRKVYTLPRTPLTSVISSFVVTKDKDVVACDEDSINVVVQFTVPYVTLHTLSYVSIYCNDLLWANTTPAPATDHNKTFTFGPRRMAITDNAMLFTIQYLEISGMSACPVSVTLDMPTRLSCAKDEAAICENETYTWQGVDYTRPVGTHVITNPANVHDTLLLTVNAMPRISVGTVDLTCDNASAVRFPFTVTNGNPDLFDVAINGTHYTATAMGSDIVFSMPVMDAGDYTATVTVGETGTSCETVETVGFTVALSDQVYSKWTDLLFVNNAGNRFTAYQWYADGVALAGDTLQRLYDPAGMSGTPTVYYCRLTTADGQTLYTCPLTFDEAVASRTQSASSQVIPLAVYDAMGRPVTGTLGRGIYIVVEMVDGERRTRKLIVNE